MIPPGEKIVEKKICRLSGREFFITDKDLEFYDKVSPIFGGKKYLIPSPTLCPDERHRRRMTFRNERKLYKRKCDKTGKDIISVYAPNKQYTVYDQKVWFGDDWSAADYGIPVDLNMPFFSQVASVWERVPLQSTSQKNTENSDYSLFVVDSKNLYLVVSIVECENMMYGAFGSKNRFCNDFLRCHNSENCYEVIDVLNCFGAKYCQDCENCSDIIFCFDCHSCQDCFMCSNLRNKQYYINNQPLSKEEYHSQINKMNLSLNLVTYFNYYLQLKKKSLHKFIHGVNNSSVTGDYLNFSNNCYDCFDLVESEDNKYCMSARGSFHCYDSYSPFTSEYCCEMIGGLETTNSSFSISSWNASDNQYVFYSQNLQSCFGCVSMKTGSHCILNKSYSTQEYETLCGKIIDHMKSTGEWGEFFPHHLSPFGYNETVAQEYFPMTEDEVREKGWNWHTEEEKKFKEAPYLPLPITQYDERIVGFDTATKNINECLNGIIQCQITKKPFRIIKQELAFYIENSIPIPTKHPDQRHTERMDLRNPRTLYEGTCAECRKDIVTTYAPERPEKVVCEECYRKLVY